MSEEIGGPEAGEVIDVDDLVADIRGRAAALRERGAYPQALLDLPFDLDADDDDGTPLAGPITLRPERGYSSKPIVGAPITGVKRVAERLVHHVVQDGLDQASIRIEHLARMLEDSERQSRERVEDLSRSVSASEQGAAARLAETREEVAALRARIEEVAAAVERVEALLARGGDASPGG